MDLPPCSHSGVTRRCFAERYHQLIDGSFRLNHDWTGWRVQDRALIGPRGMRFTPQTLAIAWRYLSRVDAIAVDATNWMTELKNLRELLDAGSGTHM